MALSVLIVDDSRVMRTMIRKVLDLSGVVLAGTLEAGSGVEALRIIQEQPVDLVLLDINMPEMSGIEVLNRLRQDQKTARLPVVVVSTEGSASRVAELRALGAAFVRKPFAPENLVDAIVMALGGQSHVGPRTSIRPSSDADF